MTLGEVKTILDAQLLCGEELLEQEVHTACGSDLMSDVLAFVKDQAVLLTGLMNLTPICPWRSRCVCSCSRVQTSTQIGRAHV